MFEQIHLTGQIPETSAGRRLDQVLAELFPSFSRSRLQQWIKAGKVLLNQQPVIARYRVAGGEQVEIRAQLQRQTEVRPQDIPLDIRFQDQHLLVLNKPAGLVVHPAAGNPDGTLQNALLHHDPELASLPRAGIVHRLDMDTSGLIVAALNEDAHTALSQMVHDREIKRF